MGCLGLRGFTLVAVAATAASHRSIVVANAGRGSGASLPVPTKFSYRKTGHASPWSFPLVLFRPVDVIFLRVYNAFISFRPGMGDFSFASFAERRDGALTMSANRVISLAFFFSFRKKKKQTLFWQTEISEYFRAVRFNRTSDDRTQITLVIGHVKY